ncbi:Do family serine endopeptidase [Thiospirillum jenense]|uniref:Probable periplasmic serine endoprotease DegP-like n=1 Tax=Thiospirillum jenense TaxID=1653858 RepID=A0A839HEH0_9GAMM|nr:Do family serine endopeptidase [Thiospirillum jenense]MBB1125419.1 Do family serine endopeptidase [Thiospirillum jenense]
MIQLPHLIDKTRSPIARAAPRSFPRPPQVQSTQLAGFIALICGSLITAPSFAAGTPPASATTAPPAVVQTAPATAGPVSFADIAARVTPAVVNVTVLQTPDKPARDWSKLLPRELPDDSPLHEFFRHFHGQFEQFGDQFGREPRQEGQGSGFIIDPKGYVVTNHHVIADADQISVTLTDGRRFDAKLVGRDVKTDLALLKITSPTPLPAVALGTSTSARVGDWVLAIGNPFGLGGSVSAGIISARGRDIQSGPYDDYLQIDAPINRGNSGGPLFDASGKVIGVNTAIYSPSGGNIGIGFAIPAETVAMIVNQLREKGTVERGWLGIQIQPVTDEIAASLGLNNTRGILVTGIIPAGPAANSDLRAGDVILQLNGQALADYRELTRRVAELPAGSTAQLLVLRGNQQVTVAVQIGQMPSNETAEQLPQLSPSASDNHSPAAAFQLGLYLAELTPARRVEYGLNADVTGVVVTQVQPGSAAAQAGIQPGSVISMVGQQAVAKTADVSAQLQQAIKDQRPAVLLRIERGGEQRFIAVPFEKAAGQ